MLNLSIDPAKLFDRQYEYHIAKILTKGSNVGGIGDFDERILQKYRASSLKAHHIDWLVIGSSRSMQISHSLVDTPLINMSVSGASIEDYVAILYIATHSFSPRYIVIGVDPWIFNKNNGQTRWKSLANEYLYGLQELAQIDPLLSEQLRGIRKQYIVGMRDKILQLINYEYTKKSLSYLIKNKGTKGNLYFSQKDAAALLDGNLIRADGSLVYSQRYATLPIVAVREAAARYAQPPVYSLEQFEQIDKDYSRIFEALLDNLKKKSKVIILLTPYHPVTYGLIAPRYPILKQVEEYIREISASKGIEVIGSYNPAIAKCDEQEFYDGMHPKSECISRLIRPIAKDE